MIIPDTPTKENTGVDAACRSLARIGVQQGVRGDTQPPSAAVVTVQQPDYLS